MSELNCCSCREPLDLARRSPRVLPACGHTFCSACISGWLVETRGRCRCPEDGREVEVDPRLGLAAFPQNIALRRLLGERPSAPPRPGLCGEHGESLDLVCSTDSVLVCADCVLFGAHRGHEYARASDFLAATDERLRAAEQELVALGRHPLLADIQRRMTELQTRIVDKQRAVETRLDEHFAALRSCLDAQQDRCRSAVERRGAELRAAAGEFELGLSRIVESELGAAQLLEEARAVLQGPAPAAQRLLAMLGGPADPAAALRALAADIDAAEETFHALGGRQLRGLEVSCDTHRAAALLSAALGVSLGGDALPAADDGRKSGDSSFLITNDGEPTAGDSLAETERALGGAEAAKPSRSLVKAAKNAASAEALAGADPPPPGGRRLIPGLRSEATPQPGTSGGSGDVSLDVSQLMGRVTPLSFRSLRITDQGLGPVIAEAARNKKAQCLNLDNNRISAAGFEALLRRLGAHEGLQRLSLANNLLDDTVFARLEQCAGGLCTLRVFAFGDNRLMKMSARAKRIRAELQKAGFVFEM